MVRSKKKKNGDSELAEPQRKRRKEAIIQTPIPAQNECNISYRADGEDSFFKCFMIAQGFVFENDAVRLVSDEDQMAVKKNLQLSLRSHKEYPQALKLFVHGFESFISEDERLIQCLVPISGSIIDEIVSTVKFLDSLAKLFLGIDMLQVEVMRSLLERLAICDTVNFHVQGREVNISQLIINQFRWLDHIVDETGLILKLFDVISASELEIQREIIVCIPEVISDSKHSQVCQQLMKLLQNDSRLRAPVIDAFTSLNLKGPLLRKVRQSILDILEWANVEDCPACVRFILQSIEDNDCVQVFQELRSRLALEGDDAFSVPRLCSTAREKQLENRNSELLILDLIRLAIRFQKPAAAGWLKVIESVDGPGKDKILDFYSLVVIHGISNKKKTVELLLKQKVKSNALSEAVVEKAFTSYSEAFIGLVQDVLSIAETLFRSPENVISNYGSKIYEQAFVNFPMYCQQEVIAALITHVGSGMVNDVESAFRVIHGLVETHPAKMAPFTVFLKGMLDHLDKFTTSQLRRLFSMISSVLARYTSALLEDDIYILIQKNLSSQSVRNKRIGIIGSVMIAASMSSIGRVARNDKNVELEVANELEASTLKEVISLLEMTLRWVSKDPEAVAFLYDELSGIVTRGQLDPTIVHLMSDKAFLHFQEAFIVKADEFRNPGSFELWYSNEEGNNVKALNISPLLLNEAGEVQQPRSSSSFVTRASSPIIYIGSLFRFLAVGERALSSQSLEKLKGFLNLPVVFFANETLDKLDLSDTSEKGLVCTGMFFLINWFREVINAFADQHDPTVRRKNICLIEEITSLGERLCRILQDVPNFVPPCVVFGVEDLNFKPLQASNFKGRKKRKGPRKESSAKDGSNKALSQKDTENGNGTSVDEKADDSMYRRSFPWWLYRCFLREFDMKVFNILKYGALPKNFLGSEENDTFTLSSRSLQMLLKDLERKVFFALPSSKAAKKSLLKQKTDKNVGFSELSKIPFPERASLFIDLIPSLCSHLEDINSHFESVLNESMCSVDKTSDGAIANDVMLANFHSILSCLHRIVSWEKLNDAACKAHLKVLLVNIASRIRSFDEDEATISSLLRVAVEYFVKLCSSHGNLITTSLILRILEGMQQFDESDEAKRNVCAIASDRLKNECGRGSCENGSMYSEALSCIIKQHIDSSERALDTLEQYTNILGDFLEERPQKSLPCLQKSTFPVFYRVVSDCLPLKMKQNWSCEKEPETEHETLEMLNAVKCCVRIFNSLTSFVKVVETRSALSSALKNGGLFLEAFLKHCMPILDLTLKKNKDEVHGILKSLQQSTRLLHHFCGHSKVAQDMTLTSFVPLTKKFLETFVFRVKAMLAVNQCHSAFWLGNLKNRDIHGNEIHSQSSFEENGIDDKVTTAEEELYNTLEVDGHD